MIGGEVRHVEESGLGVGVHAAGGGLKAGEDCRFSGVAALGVVDVDAAVVQEIGGECGRQQAFLVSAPAHAVREIAVNGRRESAGKRDA